LTKAELIEKLQPFPDDAKVYGYNGLEEAMGVVFRVDEVKADEQPYVKGDPIDMEEGEVGILICNE